jgi:saccharopine dehydrogenase-like NADP-dependent oxidoreductase
MIQREQGSVPEAMCKGKFQMKILVLGSGLMGPAAAFNAMLDPAVSQVTLCDMNQQQLGAAQAKLESMEGGEKLSAVVLDLNDQEAASKLMADFNAIVAAFANVQLEITTKALN